MDNLTFVDDHFLWKHMSILVYGRVVCFGAYPPFYEQYDLGGDC